MEKIRSEKTVLHGFSIKQIRCPEAVLTVMFMKNVSGMKIERIRI